MSFPRLDRYSNLADAIAGGVRRFIQCTSKFCQLFYRRFELRNPQFLPFVAEDQLTFNVFAQLMQLRALRRPHLPNDTRRLIRSAIVYNQ